MTPAARFTELCGQPIESGMTPEGALCYDPNQDEMDAEEERREKERWARDEAALSSDRGTQGITSLKDIMHASEAILLYWCQVA